MSLTPIQTYLPSMIRDAGFDTTTANLLTVPSYIINQIFSIIIAWSSDRYGEVALHALIGVLWQLASFLALLILPPDAGRWSVFAAATMANAAPSWHGMHIAWMSANLAPAGKRALALGAIIGFANINSVPGAQIYRKSFLILSFYRNSGSYVLTRLFHLQGAMMHPAITTVIPSMSFFKLLQQCCLSLNDSAMTLRTAGARETGTR